MLDQYDKTWNAPALVDYSDPMGVLTPTRQAELIAFLKLGTAASASVSPVLSPYVTPLGFSEVSKVLGERKITLRVRVEDALNLATHQPAISTIMNLPSSKALVNRLIVDLRCTPKAALSDAQVQSFANAIKAFKSLGFAHIHLASGAFPQSLMNITGAGEIKRNDWELWKRVAAASAETLIGFSDYGPLTPEWTEETLTRRGGRSVIRYALADKWRILRAPSNKIADSVAISKLLVDDYPSEFKGRAYSFGDFLIDQRADDSVPLSDKRSGHYHITEFWSHHIAYVVKDQY